MRIALTVLLLVPSLLLSQQTADLSGAVTVEIRSADTLRVLNVKVDLHGNLFDAIGVLRPASGTVECGPDGCVVTTPTLLELTTGTGGASLSVPEGSPEIEVTVLDGTSRLRRVVAHGRVISFTRSDAGGALTFSASRMTNRF